MSDNKLPIIKPDARQQVFNGIEVSYGIAPILSTFSRLGTQSNKPFWTLFLVNVETIIRDCMANSERTTSAQATLRDCTVLAQYIATYCRAAIPRGIKERPLICFYLGHYENIPKLYLRDKFPKDTEERWRLRDKIEQVLRSDGFAQGFEGTDILFMTVGLKGGWPHRELFEDIFKKTDTIRFRKVLMISHVPLDFHLYRMWPKSFQVLESFTGALKDHTQFGKKVFKNDLIPFNKYTHLLYGDSYYLKSLLTRANKMRVKEVATKERWNLLPEKKVLESIIRLNLVQPDLYIKPEI